MLVNELAAIDPVVFDAHRALLDDILSNRTWSTSTRAPGPGARRRPGTHGVVGTHGPRRRFQRKTTPSLVRGPARTPGAPNRHPSLTSAGVVFKSSDAFLESACRFEK